MAIRLFLSFVMVLSVASQQNRMSDFGKRQPMTDNSQWMMETSQSQGQNKGFQRQGRQDIKPLSSSGAAPQDIPTMIRTELGNFMPMFVETAVKSILPKIESTVNRTVSGAISSLLQSTITSIVQSTLNSAGKPTPMEPFSTSQTVCSPSCRPSWASLLVRSVGTITSSANPVCRFAKALTDCSSNSLTPTCVGTDMCCPLDCYKEMKLCWAGTPTTSVCIPKSFGNGQLGIGQLLGNLAPMLGSFL